MEKTEKRKFGISSSTLHILAMVFMLCDHAWATVFSGNQWLNSIGRLAYPIFAFLLVEGYFHTRDLKKYVLRMLLFALISEIPFNLMMAGTLIYPFDQNVIWTMLWGILFIWMNERVKKTGVMWKRILAGIGIALLALLAGTVTFVDYGGVGILIILMFYYLRGKKWWCLLGQVVIMYYLNVVVLKGMEFPVELFGREFFISQQGLALFSLIPIWLYNGTKGIRSKAFQYCCYAFYPEHMVILYLISAFISR